jgi:NTE family protein
MPMTRLGHVLGAGGRAGAAYHRGVVTAMRDAGLDPRAAEVIVGTSAGSLIGAALRREAPARPSPQLPADTLRRLRRGAVLDLARRPREGVNALLLRPDFRLGRLDISDIVAGVRRAHGAEWPAAALWVVAARRADGKRVVFGRPGAPATDVATACAASCAVPGWVKPIVIDGQEYVDGGMHSPTNADLLADCDLGLIVISSPMSVQAPMARPRMDLPFRVRFHRFLRSEVWALRKRGVRVLPIEPDRETSRLMGLRMLNTRHSDEIEQLSYAHARRRLATLASDVDGSAVVG